MVSDDMLLLGRDLSPQEMRNFVFYTDAYSSGSIKDVSEEQLQKYMANPERFYEQLRKYSSPQFILF